MWSIVFQDEPAGLSKDSKLLVAKCDLTDFFRLADRQETGTLLGEELYTTFVTGGRTSCVALADYVARHVGQGGGKSFLTIESLDSVTTTKHVSHRSHRSNGDNKKRRKPPSSQLPYILERSDIWCSKNKIHLHVRVTMKSDGESRGRIISQDAVVEILNTCFSPVNFSFKKAMEHIACCVLQERIREALKGREAIAFVANGSILPRKSGASQQPMACPPAVPFQAPDDSSLNQEIQVGNMGSLTAFLNAPVQATAEGGVRLTGMLIPRGVVLICGGGYHGKSTLLRTIAGGVYNRVLGDGREFCVSLTEAVCVRAEDGRYVNNCNVSAFISNLPALAGSDPVDTSRFSSRDASGSTSQAANVSEAIEMGAKVLLVDEDVSAANFMARDGRMRALVADESITPLLYRVNGLFNAYGISSIVVVGGVGDWLDVPHKVLLLNKYVASDATKKANSISRQFSHGHVQYGGRGVVHRLPWDRSTTPHPRKISKESLRLINRHPTVSLIDGGTGLMHLDTTVMDEETDDDFGQVDISRCEQLPSDKKLLAGIGVSISSVLSIAKDFPDSSLASLIDRHEALLNDVGMNGKEVFPNFNELETAFYYRPRRYEIFMAMTRLRGLQLDELPLQPDEEEEAARREEERKKSEMAALWENRRSKNRFS